LHTFDNNKCVFNQKLHNIVINDIVDIDNFNVDLNSLYQLTSKIIINKLIINNKLINYK